MEWLADPEQAKQLAGYLRDSLNGRDPNAQRNATMVSLFSALKKSLKKHAELCGQR